MWKDGRNAKTVILFTFLSLSWGLPTDTSRTVPHFVAAECSTEAPKVRNQKPRFETEKDLRYPKSNKDGIKVVCIWWKFINKWYLGKTEAQFPFPLWWKHSSQSLSRLSQSVSARILCCLFSALSLWTWCPRGLLTDTGRNDQRPPCTPLLHKRLLTRS